MFQGKLSVGPAVTFADDVTTATGAGKTMIGGTGTYGNAITIAPSRGEHTFHELDPGLAASVSLSSQASGYQVVQNPENTIGEFTAAGLTWATDGVFNWEIKNFDPSGGVGTDWDHFDFTGGDDLDMSVTGRKIRILGITPTEYAGGAGAVWDPRHGTADGEMGIPSNWAPHWPGDGGDPLKFKFMTAEGAGGFSGNTDGDPGGGIFSSTYFDIDDSQSFISAISYRI